MNGLPPNWIGSRWTDMDLSQPPPLHGPVVIVPPEPEDGPSPAQQRQHAASPDNLVARCARALEGDTEALKGLGGKRPERLTLIDVRPTIQRLLDRIGPDGHIERRAVDSDEEGQAWIDGASWARRPASRSVPVACGPPP